MDSTFLTTCSSLPPECKPSYTNTTLLVALNTQRTTTVPQTLHPTPIQAMNPSFVRLCNVCPYLKSSTNRSSDCFRLAQYLLTVEGNFFPVALSPQRVPHSGSCLKGSLLLPCLKGSLLPLFSSPLFHFFCFFFFFLWWFFSFFIFFNMA